MQKRPESEKTFPDSGFFICLKSFYICNLLCISLFNAEPSRRISAETEMTEHAKQTREGKVTVGISNVKSTKNTNPIKLAITRYIIKSSIFSLRSLETIAMAAIAQLANTGITKLTLHIWKPVK